MCQLIFPSPGPESPIPLTCLGRPLSSIDRHARLEEISNFKRSQGESLSSIPTPLGLPSSRPLLPGQTLFQTLPSLPSLLGTKPTRHPSSLTCNLPNPGSHSCLPYHHAMSGSSARRFTEKDLHNGNDHHDHKKDDWNEGERDGSPAALGRSRTSEQEANAARLRVTMTISFHITVALATTLLNKWALNLVPMPDVLLSMQMGLCVIFSWWIWAFNLGDVGSLMLSWEEVRTMWKYLGMRTIGVGMKVWCLNVSLHRLRTWSRPRLTRVVSTSKRRFIKPPVVSSSP